MVDLHTHILPGIDDGANDMDLSLEMLEIAAANGTRHIFATPHFIMDSLENSPERVIEKCLELEEKAAGKVSDIRIIPGSEIFLCPQIPSLIQEGKVCALGNSRYLLIELPMLYIPPYTGSILYQLKLAGWQPILAHPERNAEIIANPDKLYNFVKNEMLAQVNSGSITGIYGKRVQEAAVKLIQHNMIQFVASDAHSCRGRPPRLNTARKQVEAVSGMDMAVRLFEKNGLAVVENREIDAPEPEPVRGRKTFYPGSVNRPVSTQSCLSTDHQSRARPFSTYS